MAESEVADAPLGRQEWLLLLVEAQASSDEFWARVDGTAPGSAADLFTDDGHFSLGPIGATGREPIRDLLTQRTAASAAMNRSTRHVASGYRLTAATRERMTLRSFLQVHAAIGALPQPSALPTTTGDFEDVLVRGSDGIWRFLSRTAVGAFTGSATPGFARPVDQGDPPPHS